MKTREQPAEFRIHGLDCAEEVAILKREFTPLVGNDRLAFDILRGKMSILPGTPALAAAQVRQVVARTGMRAEEWQDVQPGSADLGFWQRRGRTISTSVSGLLLLLGFGIHALTAGFIGALGSEAGGVSAALPALSLAAYASAILAGSWFVASRAWRAVLRLRPDMNLLMTIAVIGAATIGEWFEAAVVSFLFALSLALESWSVGRARRAVEALLAIAPDKARLLDADGVVTEVAAADVLAGSRIMVRPGDRLPLDGTVLKGQTTINQAPITGESVPVEKEAGSDVFAGTINGEGAIEVEVTRVAGESTLAQIIRMVSEAQSRRAPAEQWVDRFAQVYTPAIFGVAILIAVAPPLLFDAEWAAWIYRSLVLLVIGCPCALVISTPVSIVASLAAAARHGVLVKGGAFIEIPAKMRALAMDKTGTLTLGSPTVVDIVPLSGHTREELLAAMGAVEAHSDHPLARAIVSHVKAAGIANAAAEDVRAVNGRGVTARINGKQFWLGSHRYLEELGQETPELHDHIERLSTAGRTVVVMGDEQHVCGFITLADAVRLESAPAIRELREAGVQHIVMLTGDNRATADRIAAETGLTDVKAELLPADKVAAVEDLVREHGVVGMIGDGVNDAPAMGRASIGIAMGAAGSDAAIEAADVALMADDLTKLSWLIRHSRKTLAIIRQNVILSIGVKAVFVILTFAGYSALWLAITADMGVSLLVIANALRLLKS